MVDQYTEVTSKGWFARISESIKGVLAGGLMFLAAFPVLWWNEGRSVKTYKSLQEGRGAVVSVAAETADPANDGRLVHVSGLATTQETVSDPVFGVAANAIRLARQVEMHQWVEDVKTEKQKKLGGGEETRKTYSYSKAWRDGLVRSSSFAKPEGHENPAGMPYESHAWGAKVVTIGGFQLSDGLKSSIRRSEAISVDDTMLAGLSDELRSRARPDGDTLYVGADPAQPAVGDLRIRFQKVPATDVSIVAQQTAGLLGPYQTAAGNALEMLELGNVSASKMFTSAEESNVALTWGMRLGGFLLMLIGLSMVFRPLAVVADVVPIIGDLVSMGTGLVAFAIAAPLWLLTIAIAWIVYRPLLGITLLVVGAGLFFGFKSMAGRRAAARARASATA